jgi:hypothetical protein
MGKEMWQAAGVVLGFLIGLPMVYACIQVGRFFGHSESAVKSAVSEIKELRSTIEKSNEKIDECLDQHREMLADHDKRIAVVESWSRIDHRQPNMKVSQ